MDELIYKMLELGLGSSQQETPAGGATAAGGKSDSESDEGVVFEGDSAKSTREKLVVEQVKVVDHEGTLKVLYPSRTDLNNEQIEVIRNFD